MTVSTENYLIKNSNLEDSQFDRRPSAIFLKKIHINKINTVKRVLQRLKQMIV